MKHTFKLKPGQTRPLEPDQYKVKAGPDFRIVIATIHYDHNIKKFDLNALDRVDGARFTNTVNLEP